MTLYFITGNKNKFKEVKAILSNVEQLNIDLPEIQELDAKKIINFKLLEALKHKKGEFIVEDTSLYFKGLKGLPGPLIKWFLETIGNERLYKLYESMNCKSAEARTIMGYAKNSEEIHYFEGVVKGTVVKPKRKTKFGWDPIFQPDGYDKTFAEIKQKEKNEISMRRIAIKKLINFLNKKVGGF